MTIINSSHQHISSPIELDPRIQSTSIPSNSTMQYKDFVSNFSETSLLVEDIVLKKYITKLTNFKLLPLSNNMKQISDIRLFKINEMVYQKDEYSTYKFASVFNSVQNLNCGVFIVVDSDGQKTDFYMGVRSLDNVRTTKSLKDTLKNSLCGHFPGVKTRDLLDTEAEELLASIKAQNIAIVSCVANNKDSNFNSDTKFIQGLEKLSLAMQDQRYTAIVLAKSASVDQISNVRHSYESIFTHLSPFSNMQVNYGTNTALSISDAFTQGLSTGTAKSTTNSTQSGSTKSESYSKSSSTTKEDVITSLSKGIIASLSLAAAPISGGASLLGAASLMAALPSESITEGSSESKTLSETTSTSYGETETINENITESNTITKGLTNGTTESMQLTVQNKTIANILERLESQLKRIDECESHGMWESAAYFLSDSQETTEMAAGTYKALMKGERSGVETSAINFWGRRHTNSDQLPLLREYITNFIHPNFIYHTNATILPVTPSTLISSNELAIQMGLPRKSVSGFPVIEHAEFGREIIKYGNQKKGPGFILGNVFVMGTESNNKVVLDRDSLTMHTFITGSTGSGKSNTIYEILNQIHDVYNIPFLVIEPAKGEYKNVFGNKPDVTVFGTNPKKTSLLRINPFRFPHKEIHVLEHLDRLVELFNVCWPMYAAMPAILKEAMENAYSGAGWNLSTSENPKGELYPNFADLLQQIECVIDNSKYSTENKGNYAGALCTRVKSLTNGINGLIFTSDDLKDDDLFDKNVIVDLSRVGSTETKSLIIGLLIIKLNEYRMSTGKMNSSLEHITVLEEAHNILKRTSLEQASESSNLLGKSVELLSNSIAEMRTYGEGFIIADQSPGLLDMSVIRNTNTKIILRLPDRSDRELVGYAAGLNENQIEELTILERGVAAIHQNDWVEPLLIKVSKSKIGESEFMYENNVINDANFLKEELLNFLLQGYVSDRLHFDVNRIESNLMKMGLSTRHQEFVEEQIDEYRVDNKLSIWKNEGFEKMSRRLTEMLNVRIQIENVILTAVDYGELTEKLRKIALQYMPNASAKTIRTLCQVFMLDFKQGKDEAAKRSEIYKSWYNSILMEG